MVAQMAKRTGKGEPSEDVTDAKKKGGLKVAPEDAQLVNLIATHRGLSVEKLFKEKDVKSFWEHLLRLELKKTSDQLGA
jgi:hypothetical protein